MASASFNLRQKKIDGKSPDISLVQKIKKNVTTHVIALSGLSSIKVNLFWSLVDIYYYSLSLTIKLEHELT